MGYSFTGTCVYLSVSSNNAQYIVSIDSDETQYGSSSSTTPAPSNCTFGWTRTNLTGTSTHFLQISVFGAIDSRRDIEAPWALEIQNLVITKPDSSVSTNSQAEASTTAVGSGSLNAASTTLVPWRLVIFTVLLSICFYM